MRLEMTRILSKHSHARMHCDSVYGRLKLKHTWRKHRNAAACAFDAAAFATVTTDTHTQYKQKDLDLSDESNAWKTKVFFLCGIPPLFFVEFCAVLCSHWE